MHFLVIAAFAIVLSARTPARSWWWFESTGMTYAVVAGQLAGIVLLAWLSSRWAIRRLERRPWSPDPAQRLFARADMVLHALVLISLGVDVLLTPWTVVVRKQWRLENVAALDDLVAVMPFFLGVILCWAVRFQADHAIRDLATRRARFYGAPARPSWRLREYLVFNVRHHLLLIVVPMTGILLAYDLVDMYAERLYAWTRLDQAEPIAVMIIAGGMFLISPFILRYVWGTSVLPHDGLRVRLENICNQIRLRYQQILIWRSDGVLVNASVMGLVPTFRYILLSDGLLETMNEQQVEAVFGHEAGHVKHHHIQFYLLFAVVSMLVVAGMMVLVWQFLPYSFWQKWLDVSRDEWNNVADLIVMGMVLLFWLIGFGWVSRRFERQADVFGVRCIGWNMDHCGTDCLVHHPPAGELPDRKALCPAAADVFAGALHRIAILNGIRPTARSWRHSSIASRMALVRLLARDRRQLRRFNRIIALTKLILLAGTIAGAVIITQEYWPEDFVTYWFDR